MDEPNLQLWDTEMTKPTGSRFLNLDASNALGFLGRGPSHVSKRYLEFVGKRNLDKRYAEFIGKRSDLDDTDDKRFDKTSISEYLSKRLRLRRPEFVGKRAQAQKRYLEFIG
ncbi:hypothetical protein SNE40_014587 [Patella caerulea]|uniref:Uncharacterized protein n=1 Tax=Patella caerulea TaxID=87958 RepID=A0AAN8JH75_PATCE